MTWFYGALIAAVLLAIASLLEKRILQKEHTLEFSVVFSVIVAMLALPLLVTVTWVPLSVGATAAILGASVFSSLSFYFSMKCVRHMDISFVAPWFAVAPVFSALFAFIFLGEQLTRFQLSGVILLVVGAYVLQSKRGMSLGQPLVITVRSPAFRFLAAALICFGLGDVLGRLLLTHYHMQPTLYLVIVEVLVAVELIILLYCSHDGFKRVNWTAQNTNLLLLLVALLTISHRYLQVQATAVAYVGLVSAIKRSSSFFTIIIGGELFHETHLVRKCIAAAIMIAGVIFVVI